MGFSKNETLECSKNISTTTPSHSCKQVQETTLTSYLVELHSTLSEYDMVLVSDLRTISVLFVRNGLSFSSFRSA